MSTISEKLNGRHNAICDYFKNNSFGRDPSDLTVLSLLPPVDRCFIIERVMEFGSCDFLTCIDKLSMAYYKADMDKVAFEFIEKCDASGWLRGGYDGQYFYDKLSKLAVHNISCSYSESLSKLPQYDTGSRFCQLIRQLCFDYQGFELFDGTETDRELVQFVNERREFIHRMTRNRDKEAITPSEMSGAGRGFALANTHAIAMCYLLGGARVTNFKFATTETLAQSDDSVRQVWNETEPLVRSFSPYPYSFRRDNGERAYLVSMEFPCYGDWSFQYRTSRQRISINDVVDLMYEVMDVKPREKRIQYLNGEKTFRFSWMFLEDDVARLLEIFPSVEYRYGCWVQQSAVYRDMDRILNTIARQALHAYPFMECEFTGW